MLRSRHFGQLIGLAELSMEFIGCEFKVINEIRGLGFAAEVLKETSLNTKYPGPDEDMQTNL